MGLKLKENFPGNVYDGVLHFRSETYLFQGQPIDQYVSTCQPLMLRDIADSPYSPIRSLQDKMIWVVAEALVNN